MVPVRPCICDSEGQGGHGPSSKETHGDPDDIGALNVWRRWWGCCVFFILTRLSLVGDGLTRVTAYRIGVRNVSCFGRVLAEVIGGIVGGRKRLLDFAHGWIFGAWDEISEML